MRLLCSTASLAAAAALAAAAGPGTAAPTSDTATATPAPWALISVSRDQRTLFVRYESGGCYYGGHAKVTQTATTVVIEVSQYLDSTAQVCPAIVGFPLLAVPLGSPIAGRRLAGNRCPVAPSTGCPPPGPVEVFHNNDVLRQVPRLVGLAVADARGALRRQGFAVAVRGRGPVVVGQRPAAATAMGQEDRRRIELRRGQVR